MADKSSIEWTDATWNPVRGCTRVSPGCGGPGPHGGCYAEVMAARFSKSAEELRDEWFKEHLGEAHPAPFKDQWGHGFAEMKGGDHRWTGKVELIKSQLDLPLHWKKPRRIFVNSTSDLFHEKLPDEAIDRVFAIMALCPQHTFQVLTKRPERMRAWAAGNEDEGDAFTRIITAAPALMEDGDLWWSFLNERGWPLPNVWLGVSCEDQERWDERVRELGATPAAVRFVSAEPLLGPIDCGNAFDPTFDGSYHPIDWVIVGGESGPGARPMHPDWARSLRDQCANAGVPFFFKQWGEWGSDEGPVNGSDRIIDGRARCAWFDGKSWRYEKDGYSVDLTVSQGAGEWVYRHGKKRAGRLLDGVEHNGFPRTAP